MANNMTFHESYGTLPKDTLRLVKRFNVSPADFDMILDQFMGPVPAGWSWVNDHILLNSTNGYYQPKFF